ncbi:hypothetical protein BG004_002802 [Podila humilis]|nr:hypothetical protein BG004_002802 [Podila humilis]
METKALSAISTSPTSFAPKSPCASPPKMVAQATKNSPTMTITPDNDPHPSWAFFPASATYIPQASFGPPSPTRPSPPPQANNMPSNKGLNNNQNIPSSTPSTHHRILDHCFHLSIETRLKQAETQYLAAIQEQAIEQELIKQEEQHQPPMSALKQDDWRRRQRTLVDEAVVLGRKGSNVEAIVDGILKSHRSSGPLQTLPRHLKHRLHLCQLTSMVFGRFDVSSSPSTSNNNSSNTNASGLNIYAAFHHSRRHLAARAAIQQQYLNSSSQGAKIRAFFVNACAISTSLYCRRHHRKDCKRTCCTLAKLQHEQQQALELKKRMMASQQQQYYMNSIRRQDQQLPGQQPQQSQRHLAGLVEAIPAFLKCSAMSYSDITKNMPQASMDGQNGRSKSTVDDSHKVLEGWYKLLLELMTQAVIESYLCDGTTGIDTILDVFSYGDDVKTEIPLPKTNNVPIDDLDDYQNTYSQRHHQQQQQLQQQQAQEAAANDRQDDILYAKTPEYKAFKEAKKARLQEILTTSASTVEERFVKLATKYPLIVFERQMTHYISRSQQLLADPKLSQHSENIGLVIPPTTSAYADGSLSMPVSDDEYDVDDEMEPCRLEEIKEEDENEEHVKSTAKATAGTESLHDENANKTNICARTHPNFNLPSPPQSAVTSRSSTVSPSLSKASLSEEDDSEASNSIQCSSSSSLGKKHKFSANENEHATKKIKVTESDQ